jgi:hypothetical protein
LRFLFDEIEFLTSNPKTGQDLDHMRKNYRYSKVKSHFIFYRHKKSKDEIEVIRILHERMDLENRKFKLKLLFQTKSSCVDECSFLPQHPAPRIEASRCRRREKPGAATSGSSRRPK